jgi:acyl-CoA thioester hydrolase
MRRFEQSITVPSDVVDMLGHVNNIEYVRWIQDVAVAHSTAVGFAWERYVQLGAAFVIRKHVVEYLRSAHAGETLTIATWVRDATRIAAQRATEITNAAGELVVQAETTWVWVSLATRRPERMPQEIRDAFSDEGDAFRYIGKR